MDERITSHINELERGAVGSITCAIRLWYHGIKASPLITEETALKIASRAVIAGLEIPQLIMLLDPRYSSLYCGIEGAQIEIRDIITSMLARKK